ncbi:MAG TPA: hypothetical protein VFC29_10350, partial [Candidatus Limnocylindrales bacterium]|nr:hypothetical protein [Candidatus Limnocylindrales bacterium]
MFFHTRFNLESVKCPTTRSLLQVVPPLGRYAKPPAHDSELKAAERRLSSPSSRRSAVEVYWSLSLFLPTVCLTQPKVHTLTPDDVKALAQQGYDPATLPKQVLVETDEARGQQAKLARLNNQRPLTSDEIAYFKSQGLDPTHIVASVPVQSASPEPQKKAAAPTPPDLRDAIL